MTPMTMECDYCRGSGIWFESFQPNRTCPKCNGSGKLITNESEPPENVKSHTQIIHFINGYKRTIHRIKSVWENEFTHIITEDGVEWIINKSNVLCVERKIK